MRLLRHRLGLRKPLLRSFQSVLALILLTASVLQGLSICFCDSSPHSCGDEHCHESHAQNCHSVPESHGNDSFDHDCSHLELAAINALVASDRIDLKITSICNKILINFISANNTEYVTAYKLKYSPGRMSQRQPPQLIYISKSIQILC